METQATKQGARHPILLQPYLFAFCLLFDVEERYNTTYRLFVLLGLCCGLISIKDTRRPPFRHTKRGGLFMGIKDGWRDEHGCWPSVGGKMCLKDPVKGLM